MRPNDIAKTGTEHAIQAALICWANCGINHGFELADAWADGALLPIREEGALPVIGELKWLHAIPNGGSRGDTAKSRAIRGAQLKAEGVKTGVADLFWPIAIWHPDGFVKHTGLYIEMKKPGGKLSSEQVEFGTFAVSQGYYWHSTDNWRDAANLIKAYYRGLL